MSKTGIHPVESIQLFPNIFIVHDQFDVHSMHVAIQINL